MGAPQISTQGKRLLEKALKNIEKYPESFNMEKFLTHDPNVKGKKPFCGTAACFAGHILIGAGAIPWGKNEDYRKPKGSLVSRLYAKLQDKAIGYTPSIPELASKALGTTSEAVDPLFYSNFQAAETNPRARVAEWLKTGQ